MSGIRSLRFGGWQGYCNDCGWIGDEQTVDYFDEENRLTYTPAGLAWDDYEYHECSHSTQTV